jgi:hypothetical protein
MAISQQVEHDAKDWQAAMEALLLVAEHDGPELFASASSAATSSACSTDCGKTFIGETLEVGARPMIERPRGAWPPRDR